MSRMSGVFIAAGCCLVFWLSSHAWADPSTAWNDSDADQLSYGGKVGIGTESPGADLDVRGTVKLAPKRTLGLTGQPTIGHVGGFAGKDTLDVEGYTSFGPDYAKSRFPSKNDAKAYVSGPEGIVLRTLIRGKYYDGMILRKHGAVGIGTDSPEALLEVKGTGDPLLVLNHIDSSGNPAIWFKQDGTPKAYIWVNLGNDDLNFGNPGKNPIISLKKDGRLDVYGTTRTKVLEITGGGDLAEPFDIAHSENIEPGMVVVIDPQRPGQLRISDKAYDRTVAGCVSGAKGINPGLTMRQKGSVADGSLPVSLSGRVYCRADASYGSIQPGDLLTTCDTPGHAMKVTDYAKAQGAVLGKAMTSLEQGQGLVLVLVTLQ